VGLSDLCIEAVGMRRYVAEQVLRIGGKSRLPRGALERTEGEDLRLVEVASRVVV
jgi:hypothetical protein